MQKTETCNKFSTRDLPIFGAKKCVLNFLHLGFAMIMTCLEIAFGPKSHTFGLIFSCDVYKMALKIETFAQNLDSNMVIFDIFEGSKKSFS